ncbi:hypothetical protein F0L74_13860 [Chitinophaga agrisoli]|uniref:Uncharacterized protein n=1 Tax=Chitinophaga agrisoli TaxID=2607653 RepID=A0A5B2VZ24_9BACT|nr:hypothetical protein [Chitinophaga agrisoli]KAA2243572.1 hypothetical protein F0L74_13860 [Chitinophaga agrisoli]
MKRLIPLLSLLILLAPSTVAQNSQKIVFDTKDATNYYLAIPPESPVIRGVLVLFCSFGPPESILPETRLPQVTCTNEILTIVASVKGALYLDTATTQRISSILQHVTNRFKVDTSKIAIGAYSYAGSTLLRYTELCYQHPEKFPVRPRAIFTVDGSLDLINMWQWCERQISKSYDPGMTGDARFISNALRQGIGDLKNNLSLYQALTPFNLADTAGNELYLRHTALRLYYDTDINWQLTEKRNSLYDTDIPDATELVNRLLLAGNDKVEFVAATRPGKRNDGRRTPTAMSIVDEPECIQWLKQQLEILDPRTWNPPYYLPTPPNWTSEVFALPPDFAPAISLKGVEHVRFAPGWGELGKADYWTYVYLWWVEGKTAPDAAALQKYLTAYYEGLIGRNIERRNIPKEKLTPVRVSLAPQPGAAGGTRYAGRIDMLDYMAQRPMTLHCVADIKYCAAAGRTAIFFQVSPQESGHPIWKEMQAIPQQFHCEKQP